MAVVAVAAVAAVKHHALRSNYPAAATTVLLLPTTATKVEFHVYCYYYTLLPRTSTKLSANRSSNCERRRPGVSYRE